MKKMFLIAAAGFTLAACSENSTKNTDSKQESKKEEISVKNDQVGRSNFAVIWNWETTDVQLVESNLRDISNELTELWKKGVVENAYFNTGGIDDKVGNFPNVAFFLKATSLDAAKGILDELIVVKKNIASYDVYPVGTLWLGRKEETNNTSVGTKTYVTVWSSLAKKPTDELVLSQNDRIMELWNAGSIENVYFDVKGTQQTNGVTDFVFFINAESEENARAMCNDLPFSKEAIASYALFPSGVFWMGKFQ